MNANPLARPAAGVHGFTLAELAVVMVIVGLLLGGLLLPLTKQMDGRTITETTRQLEEIKEALIGFALANGRLPCPAVPDTPSGTTVASLAAGTERTTCTGSNASGVLPWATLGIRETDAWGRRLTYRVTATFAASTPPNYGCASAPSPTPSIAYALCSTGDMTIYTKTPSSRPAPGTTIASNVVAIIISHGKNGYGAYMPSGLQMSSPPAVNIDETLNKTVGTSFITRERSDYTDICSDTLTTSPFCEYDDIIAWIPYTTLLGKTVAAGKLP